MDESNFLNLVPDSRSLKNVGAQIHQDVVTNCLGHMGNLIFALLSLVLDTSAKQVEMVSAQLWGFCGNADRFLADCRMYFETKACIAKASNYSKQEPNERQQCTTQNPRTDRRQDEPPQPSLDW